MKKPCNKTHATGRWIKRTPPAVAVKKAAAPTGRTVVELRKMARELGHRGYSKMKKQELLTLLSGPPPVAAVKKTAPVVHYTNPWLALLRVFAEDKGIDFVITSRTEILKKFQPTGWVGAVSQQVFDRFTDRPYTLYDVLDQILEHRPELSEASRNKIRARPDAAHLLHVIQHATARYRGRDDPFTLYHGTDTRSAEAILRTGIDLGKGGGRHGTGFYVTPQPSYALHYASTGRARAGVAGAGLPCVLQFRIDADEARTLVFGDDFTFDLTSPMDADVVMHHNPGDYLTRIRQLIMNLPREERLRFLTEHVSPEAKTASKEQVQRLLAAKITTAWVERERNNDSLPLRIRDELRFSSVMNTGGIKIIARSEAAARALQVVRCFVMGRNS